MIASLLQDQPVDPRETIARYARRRGLGPFRAQHREADPAKELAKLGRAGFSYADARALLEMDPDEALDLACRR